MRYKVCIILALVCVLFSGCGSNSTSFRDAYNSNQAQENFNKKADQVKDDVTSEVDKAEADVKSQDEQIRKEAKKTSKEVGDNGKKKFEEGLDKLDEWSNTGMSTSQLVWYYVLKGYYLIRAISPSLIGLSWFAGIFLYLISFGNKAGQKFAVYGFGIGLPTLLILIRFLVPWMFAMFGNK